MVNEPSEPAGQSTVVEPVVLDGEAVVATLSVVPLLTVKSV